MIWRRRTGSASTMHGWAGRSSRSSTPLASAFTLCSAATEATRGTRSIVCATRVSRLASTLARSSTSLTTASRWRALSWMVVAHSRCSGSSSSMLSSSAKPITPLSGVRSSCDMLARNSLFMRLACSAVWRASSRLRIERCTVSAMRLKARASSASSSPPAAARRWSRSPCSKRWMPSTTWVIRRESSPAIQIAIRITASTIASVEAARRVVVPRSWSAMSPTRVSRSCWVSASASPIILPMRWPDSVAARWKSSTLAPMVT